VLAGQGSRGQVDITVLYGVGLLDRYPGRPGP
jgi:hypothetical protein